MLPRFPQQRERLPRAAQILVQQTGGTDWLPTSLAEMDSSKQFGGDASLKDYMEAKDGAASSTISVEQQAQTLARMTLSLIHISEPTRPY